MSFVSECEYLLESVHDDIDSRTSELPVLKELYSVYLKNPDMQEQLPSFVTYYFEEEFHRESNILETVHFVPLSQVQANCLDALQCRWNFLLQEYDFDSHSILV